MEDKKVSKAGATQALGSQFLRYWLAPALYVVVLLVAYVRFGFLFQFTLGAAWLCLIPVLVYFGKSREFLSNTVIFVSLLLGYEALQSVTGQLVNPGSLVSMAGLDKALVGFNLPLAVQTAFSSNLVTLIATGFYGIHLFLVVAAVILFWLVNKAVYRGYAYSIVLCSYLALITFIVMPTSPPWYSGVAQNLIPSASNLLPGPLQVLQQTLLAIESDKFAAFPSLHAAYATLFAVFAFRLNRKVGYVGLAIAIGVYFSTLYLGQHYAIDLIGGIAYALGSVLVVDRLLTGRHTQASSNPTGGNPSGPAPS